MSDATIICASRNRPRAAQELFDSFMRTRATENVHLRFALDVGDPSAPTYPPGWKTYPSKGITEAINFAAKDVTTTYIGTLCDEQRFITSGWDLILMRALDEMGGGVVYPNDLINPGTMPAFCLMSTAIVKALGWFAMPGLRYNYFDNVLKDLGQGVGKLRYFDDVYVQHLSMPQSFDNSAGIALDRKDYFEWTKSQRQIDVAKAKAALETYAETQQFTVLV